MKEFNINLKGLQDGEHEFEYKIEDASLFNTFEYKEILDAALKVLVKVLRRESHCELQFHIDGILRVACDRCLDPLNFNCNLDEFLIVKFGNHREEIDEKLVIIPEKEGILNITQYIYEYVLLSLPTQIIHKKKSDCNAEMIKKLKNYSVKQAEEEFAPFWTELKDILKK